MRCFLIFVRGIEAGRENAGRNCADRPKSAPLIVRMHNFYDIAGVVKAIIQTPVRTPTIEAY